MTTMSFTREELAKIRKETIECGANEVFCWVNSIDNDENAEFAREQIENYTVEDVIEDAENEIMSCFIVNLRKPLTKKEREWVAEYAKDVLAKARMKAGIEEPKEEPKEEQKEEQKMNYIEQIKKLTEAIKTLGDAPELEQARTQLMNTREEIYKKAVSEIKAAME